MGSSRERNILEGSILGIYKETFLVEVYKPSY